jgi:hypothetical protein
MRGDGAQCRRVAVAEGKRVRIAVYKAGSQPHFGGDRVESLARLGGRHL